MSPRDICEKGMCQDTPHLDYVFFALSDSARRSIIECLWSMSVPISHLAYMHKKSLSLMAKHVAILEKAGLVRKVRDGRGVRISLEIKSFTSSRTIRTRLHINLGRKLRQIQEE